MDVNKPIRVLVVEDSPTARALLVHAIALDPRFQIAGEARDGLEGVELAKLLRPDVISMDVMLPVLDGYEATRTIMSEVPTPVVIVTGLDTADVERSMRALQIGAVALVAKPPAPSSPEFERACRELRETLAAMAEVKVVRRFAVRQPNQRAARSRDARAELVAIAASTGGPQIIAEILSLLPSELNVPILIVQHIASGFAEGFARWLSSVGPFEVRLAKHGERIEHASILVAPDGAHMRTTQERTIELSRDPSINGFRPSADALFASAAAAYGSSTTAVILSGMGDDGVGGLAAIDAAGGLILAQDRATSLVYGMPKAAVDAGLAHEELSPKEIAARLSALVEVPRP